MAASSSSGAPQQYAPTKEEDFTPQEGCKKCPICNKAFGLTLWRYNCHWCGDVVCDDCSKSSMSLPPTYPDAVRVCDLCKVPAAAYSARGAPRKLGTAAAAGNSSGEGGAAGGTAVNYDEERAKRAAAVAARMKANATGGRPATAGSSSAKASSPSGTTGGSGRSAEEVAEEAERQRQKELRQRLYEKDMEQEQKERAKREQEAVDRAVTAKLQLEEDAKNAAATGSSASAARPANPMLEAALRRQEAAKARHGGASAAASTTVDPEKAQLISRITHLLAQQRKEEPFGLRSMDVVKLRMYLRNLES